MLHRFALPVLGLTLLLLNVGCTDQITTVTSVNFVQGTPNGSSTQPAAVVKTWPNSAWVNPSGPDWTPNGTSADLNVWCNSNGDWNIDHSIENHGLGWHSYETTVVFGRITGGDPNSFVPFASHVSDTIIVHHGNSNASLGSGTGDPAIKANFDNINAARASLHEH